MRLPTYQGSPRIPPETLGDGRATGDLLVKTLRELIRVRAGEVSPGGGSEDLPGPHRPVDLVGEGPESSGQAHLPRIVELDIGPVAVHFLNPRGPPWRERRARRDSCRFSEAWVRGGC
jgi:hypothetical protein